MGRTGQSGIRVVGIVLLAARFLNAAPVSAEKALDNVVSWAARRGVHRMGHHTRPSGKVKTISADGTDLFHFVAFDGGGFAAVAADDARPPVMAFSPDGDLPDPSEGGPLWALLGADGAAAAGMAMPRRRGDHRKMKARTSDLRRRMSHASLAAGAAKAVSPSSLSTVSDLRVAPLVGSKWDQRNVGGQNVYNYYTPNHWYCGCVATAMAQVMRYHSFPSAPVAAQTFTCYSNSVAVPLTMKGGVYDWGNMPLVPGSSITATEREAIGRLCYDAGVAMRMHYASGGSGAYGGFEHGPLVEVFGYANAESYFLDSASLSATEIENAVLANLDAGYPVLLGIEAPASSGRDAAGHAIVADGYGYEEGTLWCHLNLGWSGSHDLWYALPDIPAGGYAFTIVSSVVYNIFPQGTGQLLTGRVTDENGHALSNATVTATYSTGRGTFSTNVTTSGSGIYAFCLTMPTTGYARSRTVTLRAAYGAGASGTSSATVSASSSPYGMDFETGNYRFGSGGLSIGNSWGNDLAVTAAAGEAATIYGFEARPDETEGAGFLLSFSGTAGARYAVEWTDSLTHAVWNVWTNVLLGVEGAMSVFLPARTEEGPASRFFRIQTAVGDGAGGEQR